MREIIVAEPRITRISQMQIQLRTTNPVELSPAWTQEIADRAACAFCTSLGRRIISPLFDFGLVAR